MSAKLRTMKEQLRNVSEWSGNESLVIAREAIERIDALEIKLHRACGIIDSLAPNQGDRSPDDEFEAFIGECGELLR